MEKHNLRAQTNPTQQNTVQVGILLGSNLGDREQFLEMARSYLQKISHTPLISSAIYETEPVGPEGQKEYLNQAILINTDLNPIRLLNYCKGVEKFAGRLWREFWGSRELDIDILFYGTVVQEKIKPFIPHPWMHKRRFTLQPLSEIAPDWCHPIINQSVAKILEHLDSDEANPKIFTPQKGTLHDS
jgi:2-amino-4-hydroxy-6-hydroxymethyldihydropteridine diphosphokinase